MTAPDDWHEHNNRFLARALDWLRGRLRGESGEPWPRDDESALGILAERFGLSVHEQTILLLCAAMEFDAHWGTLCAQADAATHLPYPTFALAFDRLADPSWDCLSPHGPLRFWKLIDVNRQPGEPLIHACLTADERIVNFLKGINAIDHRLLPFLLPPPPFASALSSVQEAAVGTLLRGIGNTRVAQLAGPTSECLRVAWEVSERIGLPMARVHFDLYPNDLDEQDMLARVWQREMVLAPTLLVLEAPPHDAPAPRRLILSLRNPVIVLGSLRGLESSLYLEVGKPSAEEQARQWASLLGEGSVNLAGHFNLSLEAIERIASTAHDGEVWDQCLAHTAPRFGRLAKRIEPRAGWDDLVLAEPQRELLRQLAREVEHRHVVLDQWGFRARTARGLGVQALFLGESGTGKTLAAEVLARELKLHLVRIDLSAVVDKYIGETEKNLARIFDAADDGGTILFFDEADALFGKRTEVKDSHDRYANIEIDYLLQRMEAYQGVAILATNMKGALDAAFLRRLRFVISFPFPGPVERRAMWQRAFPPETPTADLDFERLARMNLTGGNIHSIALGAAYRAAAGASPVTMTCVLEAARAELRKLERPIHDADLGFV